jgi:hypothetical protein
MEGKNQSDFGGNMVRRCELDESGSGQGPVAGSCEYSNELSGSIKERKFLY